MTDRVPTHDEEHGEKGSIPSGDSAAGPSYEAEGRAEDPIQLDRDVVLCDICRNGMYDFHCRLICPHCGFQRDCSDP